MPGGYLFRPAGSKVWSLPQPGYWITTFPDPEVRAEWLIGTADSLGKIGRSGEAEQLLVIAETTGRKKSSLFATRASLAASQGEWSQALQLSRESLDDDRTNLMAAMIQVRALVECGRPDEGLIKARRLVENIENQETLFLLARTASSANANQEESEALQRLLSIARAHRQPLGAILTYLGQAYAKQGDRGEALRTFQEAIVTPELTEEQRRLLRGVMDHLMQGEKSSTTLPSLPPPDPSAYHSTTDDQP
jgi:tetratricopeptide (TPR) repeat protein